jgi:hypothetical protein
VDASVHRDGQLTHQELTVALMQLKDPKQSNFNPHAVLAVEEDADIDQVLGHGLWWVE